MLGIGLVLACAALFHLYKLWRFTRQFPAPGKFVDINGVPMHFMAEGPQKSQPTVVWIPGRHDSGLEMWALHKALSDHNRSIIYDRIGSGWSGINDTARTPYHEAAELYDLLQKSGEKGPYIFAGHSLGGMQATSFAQRYPESTAGVVLLDAGIADSFAYVSNFRGPKNVPGDSLLLPVMAAFGLMWFKLPKQEPEKYDQSDLGQMQLGIMAQPKSYSGWIWALNAIFDDLLSLVRMPGSLGDIPVYSVIPCGHLEDERKGVRAALPDFTDLQMENLLAIREQGRRANAALSNIGEVIIAPDGTSHNLHEEEPEYILAQVQKMFLRIADSAGEAS